ncbi:MAG: eCIS core domain-containing protein [Gemmatimonadales bacterium]
MTSDELRALGSLCHCLDLGRVRLHRGGGPLLARMARQAVLAVSRGRAIALGNHVFLPSRAPVSIPVLAHELMHCAQYQSWGPLRYYSRGLAERLREMRWQLGLGSSPYAYEADPEKPFDGYRMEQQGQIIEDCFRGSQRAAAISPYRPS